MFKLLNARCGLYKRKNFNLKAENDSMAIFLGSKTPMFSTLHGHYTKNASKLTGRSFEGDKNSGAF